MEVLWEQQSGGIWSGLTGNYIKVYARSSEDLTNKLLPVKLVKIYRDGVWGEVLKRLAIIVLTLPAFTASPGGFPVSSAASASASGSRPR